VNEARRKKRQTEYGAVDATIEIKILNAYSVYQFHYEETQGDKVLALENIYLYFAHVFNLVSNSTSCGYPCRNNQKLVNFIFSYFL